MEQILLNGISFEELQNSIQNIVETEVKKAVTLLTPQPSNDYPDYLSRKEVAQLLKISLPTLNEWTKNGTIPAKRIGTRVRYEKQAIINALKDIETLKYRRA